MQLYLLYFHINSMDPVGMHPSTKAPSIKVLDIPCLGNRQWWSTSCFHTLTPITLQSNHGKDYRNIPDVLFFHYLHLDSQKIKVRNFGFGVRTAVKVSQCSPGTLADFERTTQSYIPKEQDSLKQEFKYLELTLDMGLTWEKHGTQ
jgi:hypothetical protein